MNTQDRSELRSILCNLELGLRDKSFGIVDRAAGRLAVFILKEEEDEE